MNFKEYYIASNSEIAKQNTTIAEQIQQKVDKRNQTLYNND